MPNGVVERIAEVGPLAIAVFVVLARHADTDGTCWPSVPRIARLCGCTDRAVQLAVRRLKAARMIGSDPRHGERGQQSNVYTMDTIPPVDPVNVASPGEPGFTGGVNVASPGPVNVASPRRRLSIEGDSRKEKTCCARSARPLTFGDDDLELAKEMITAVEAVQKPAKSPDLHKWANTIRLIRESDNRPLDDIRQLFHWATANSFWRGNIRSPEKLRKHWDTLTLQKARPTNGNGKQQQMPSGPGHKFDPATATAGITPPGF